MKTINNLATVLTVLIFSFSISSKAISSPINSECEFCDEKCTMENCCTDSGKTSQENKECCTGEGCNQCCTDGKCSANTGAGNDSITDETKTSVKKVKDCCLK